MDQEEIKKYYSSGIEKGRLLQGHSILEGIRTKEIILRYLDKPGLRILDAGGGAGYYAFWLQSQGHKLAIVDLSPDNIEFVNTHIRDHELTGIEATEGDARALAFPDGYFDIVLLLGPLYHLIERTDRLKSLAEARRVLKHDGILIAAVISRYASMIDGFNRDLISDQQFIPILQADLSTGIHLNTTENPDYFTTSFFHTPDDIRKELIEAGLIFEKLIAVEGLGWLISEKGTIVNGSERSNKILDIIRSQESNPDLIAASPHIIAVARKH